MCIVFITRQRSLSPGNDYKFPAPKKNSKTARKIAECEDFPSSEKNKDFDDSLLDENKNKLAFVLLLGCWLVRCCCDGLLICNPKMCGTCASWSGSGLEFESSKAMLVTCNMEMKY